jgi:hypothetical protein
MPVSAVVLVLVGVLAGCIQGQGPVTSETREVGAFSRIEVTADFRVMLRIGPLEAVEVTAQENLLPVIATDLREGLTLSPTGPDSDDHDDTGQRHGHHEPRCADRIT